nr:hypothetical protein [Acetobacter persici]
MTFAVLTAFGGGLLIGSAAVFLKAATGHILGVSGILGNAVSRSAGSWRWAFLAGVVGAAVVMRGMGVLLPASFSQLGWERLLVAGLLTGAGTRLANGCTSGHGVCGLGNLSGRSLIAVLVFMGTAGLVVFFQHSGSWFP